MDSSDAGLSYPDYDAFVRTVATEANDPNGRAAVANVIANRQAAGGYGQGYGSIVTAPNQFEVWKNGRAQSLDPNSTQYQKAAEIVEGVLSGRTDDSTGGATHFYSPAGQQALAGDGRQLTPSWARNQTAAIGGQLFFAPNGPVQRAQNMASNGPNPDDVFSELTANAQSRGPSGSSASAAPGQSVDDVFGELTARAQRNAATAAQQPPASGNATPAATNAAMPPPTEAANATPSTQTRTEGAATGNDSAAVGAGILNGVPVAGPYLLSGVQHAAALARQATHGGSYDDALAHVQNFTNATTADHPWATTAGNALGATAATLPLMAAAPAAFGIDAASGMSAVAAGGGTGAAIGGTDAAVRSGGDPWQTALGAGIGGGAGAAGPVAGKVIGYGANKLMSLGNDLIASSRDGMSASTRNLLLDAINRDGPEAVQQQVQALGPDGMLADVGSAVQGRAQGVAVRPGGATLIQAIKDRAAGANARIRDAVAGLGPAEDPQNVTDNITALRSQIDGQNYGQALGDAPSVDASHVVDLIDGQLETAVGMQRKALENVRSELVQQGANGQQIPVDNAQILHNLKGELDNVINYDAPGLGVPAGAVNRAQGSLQMVRGALNDALEGQVPGYEAANDASAALAKRADAVQAGVDTLASGKTAPTPERFVQQFSTLSPGEQIAQAKGLIAEVNRRVGVNANDLGAMRTALQGEEGWNTAKMARVLGGEPTNALLDAVNREGTYGQTFNKVVGNAQSAFRTEASSALDQASPFGLDVDVSKVSTPGMALGALKGAVYNPLIRFMASTNTAARDAELAKVLSAQGPARDIFVNKLFQAAGRAGVVPAWADAVGRTSNALMNAGQEPYRLAP